MTKLLNDDSVSESLLDEGLYLMHACWRVRAG